TPGHDRGSLRRRGLDLSVSHLHDGETGKKCCSDLRRSIWFLPKSARSIRYRHGGQRAWPRWFRRQGQSDRKTFVCTSTITSFILTELNYANTILIHGRVPAGNSAPSTDIYRSSGGCSNRRPCRRH